MSGSAAAKQPRAVHENDLRVAGDGTGFDYDLIVIGGGSGGLACSKEAASLGAKASAAAQLAWERVEGEWFGSFHHLTPPHPSPHPPRRSWCSTL